MADDLALEDDDLDMGYNLIVQTQAVHGETEVNQPTIHGQSGAKITRSHIPDIGEGILMPKKKKTKGMVDVDVAFLDIIKGFVNFTKDAIGTKEPEKATTTSGYSTDVMGRLKLELDKFPHLSPYYRVAIGRKLVGNRFNLDCFHSIPSEEKFEYVCIEVTNNT